MPKRCVAAGCSNVADKSTGVSVFLIPFYGDERPEARKRRKKWINFVRQRRDKWEPSQHSVLCSKHFKNEDFERQLVLIDEATGLPFNGSLIRDEIGISAIPSVYEKPLQMSTPEASRKRARRVTLKNAKKRIQSLEVQSEDTTEEISDSEDVAEGGLVVDEMLLEETSECLVAHKDGFTQTENNEKCRGCMKYASRNRQLRNNIISIKQKLKDSRKILKDTNKKLKAAVATHEDITQETGTSHENEIHVADNEEENEENSNGISVESDTESDEVLEEEPDFASDTQYSTGSDTETESEDEKDTGKRVYAEDNNLRTHPKFIVFLSQLLLLFKFCHSCKAKGPLVEAKQVGTMVTVTTTCINIKCQAKDVVWRSQPLMPGTRIAAGNFLLSFAVLLAGASASKIILLFKLMGLRCYSLNTFFMHQREKLFPTIHLFWKKYQGNILNKLKSHGQPVVIAGDARHDSMGHSAKYGAYTMFWCSLPLIITFSLVQRNVAGSSQAMEFLAFQNCVNYLIGSGVIIGTLVTDRHTSIRKYVKEQMKRVTHYFDLWHIKKKIHKVLSKLSKESGCSALIEWIKPCENHFYWSATSTLSGNGMVIYAKFRSFLSHVINKHKDLDDPLFDKCAHKEIQHRKWLSKDSPVYEKMCSVLNKPSLVNGIKQASPIAQTSCLEGFHSVVNHYAPKMIAFSYVGMYCRHIIASLHFNMNLHRETRKNPDGSEQVKVVWPKFKNGEATVRDVKVVPSYEYVEDIYQSFLVAQSEDLLGNAVKELKNMTPEPMNSMLEKQSKEDAIKKKENRKSIKIIDVPATATVPILPDKEKQVRQPHCKACKKPMKGHKFVADCPKNQARLNNSTKR